MNLCLKQALLLYLNQGLFEHNGDELTSILKYAMDQGVPIIMIHERDPKRNGCDFDLFFHETPMELVLEEPYQIYNRSIAIPLYSRDEYRELGLKRVLCKLGAEEV